MQCVFTICSVMIIKPSILCPQVDFIQKIKTIAIFTLLCWCNYGRTKVCDQRRRRKQSPRSENLCCQGVSQFLVTFLLYFFTRNYCSFLNFALFSSWIHLCFVPWHPSGVNFFVQRTLVVNFLMLAWPFLYIVKDWISKQLVWVSS